MSDTEDATIDKGFARLYDLLFGGKTVRKDFMSDASVKSFKSMFYRFKRKQDEHNIMAEFMSEPQVFSCTPVFKTSEDQEEYNINNNLDLETVTYLLSFREKTKPFEFLVFETVEEALAFGAKQQSPE